MLAKEDADAAQHAKLPPMDSSVAQLLDDVERRRQAVSSELSAKHRAKLGQFFTPPTAAGFLAELLDLPASGSFRLLDPGAGSGSFSPPPPPPRAFQRPPSPPP